MKIGHQLDTNLKTSIENPYVFDCSVIPEAWGLPPSLTLVARASAGHATWWPSGSRWSLQWPRHAQPMR